MPLDSVGQRYAICLRADCFPAVEPAVPRGTMRRAVERYSGRLVDDVLDRGDHGVGGLVEDLRVLVARRGEYGHAFAALPGVGDSSAHRAHLVLGGAPVGSGANHE